MLNNLFYKNKMSLEKWEKIREWKTYTPSNTAKSWTLASLLVFLTWKEKSTLASEFSRKKLKLSNIEDVWNYLREYFKKKYF